MTYNVYNRNNKRLRSSSLDEINDDIEYEKDEKYRKNIYKYLHCLVTQNTINQDIYFLILDNDFEKIIQLLKKKIVMKYQNTIRLINMLLYRKK